MPDLPTSRHQARHHAQAHPPFIDAPGAVLPVHADVLAACRAAEGREVGHRVIARHDFYDAATRCFAVIQNSESRPYGCFILTKGVVFTPAHPLA